MAAIAALQQGTATIDTHQLATGSYLLRWSNSVATKTIKLTKQ